MCGMALLLFGSVGQSGMTAYAVGSADTQVTQSARWTGSGDQWRVSDEAGGYLKNTWFQDDVTGHWYMLGAGDGTLMYAGLVTDQATGKTYLLNTNHDGTYGRMVTTDGAYSINGCTVYVQFDQNHNGTFGAIASGLNELRSTGVQESSFANIPTAGQQTQQEDTGNTTEKQQENNGNLSEEEIIAKIDVATKGGSKYVGTGNNSPKLNK